MYLVFLKIKNPSRSKMALADGVREEFIDDDIML